MIQIKREYCKHWSAVTLTQGDKSSLFMCATVVPDAVLQAVVQFCSCTDRGASCLPSVASRARGAIDLCYGSWLSKHWPNGDLLRQQTQRAHASERDVLATTLANYIGLGDAYLLDALPDWVLAWAGEDVRRRVRDEADGVDIYEAELKIDIEAAWEETAKDARRRMELCGLTPVEETEEEELPVEIGGES